MLELQTIPLRFRVWDSCARKWVAPYPDLTYKPYGFSLRVMLEQLGKAIHALEDTRYIISQDTGLKDKNGKSIYFGDILQWGKTIGCVDMFKGYIVLDIRTFPSHAHLLYDIQNDTRVVGNIWQNKELLEEK